MTDACLFCGIVTGDVPADMVLEHDDVIAFEDKFPRAPVHVLVVPRIHLDSAADLHREHDALLGRCFQAAREVAAHKGTEEGYRITTNIGARGGQAVGHLHFHVLGGRQLGLIDSEAPRD